MLNIGVLVGALIVYVIKTNAYQSNLQTLRNVCDLSYHSARSATIGYNYLIYDKRYNYTDPPKTDEWPTGMIQRKDLLKMMEETSENLASMLGRIHQSTSNLEVWETADISTYFFTIATKNITHPDGSVEEVIDTKKQILRSSSMLEVVATVSQMMHHLFLTNISSRPQDPDFLSNIQYLTFNCPVPILDGAKRVIIYYYEILNKQCDEIMLVLIIILVTSLTPLTVIQLLVYVLYTWKSVKNRMRAYQTMLDMPKNKMQSVIRRLLRDEDEEDDFTINVEMGESMETRTFDNYLDNNGMHNDDNSHNGEFLEDPGASALREEGDESGKDDSSQKAVCNSPQTSQLDGKGPSEINTHPIFVRQQSMESQQKRKASFRQNAPETELSNEKPATSTLSSAGFSMESLNDTPFAMESSSSLFDEHLTTIPSTPGLQLPTPMVGEESPKGAQITERSNGARKTPQPPLSNIDLSLGKPKVESEGGGAGAAEVLTNRSKNNSTPSNNLQLDSFGMGFVEYEGASVVTSATPTRSATRTPVNQVFGNTLAAPLTIKPLGINLTDELNNAPPSPLFMPQSPLLTARSSLLTPRTPLPIPQSPLLVSQSPLLVPQSPLPIPQSPLLVSQSPLVPPLFSNIDIDSINSNGNNSQPHFGLTSTASFSIQHAVSEYETGSLFNSAQVMQPLSPRNLSPQNRALTYSQNLSFPQIEVPTPMHAVSEAQLKTDRSMFDGHLTPTQAQQQQQQPQQQPQEQQQQQQNGATEMKYMIDYDDSDESEKDKQMGLIRNVIEDAAWEEGIEKEIEKHEAAYKQLPRPISKLVVFTVLFSTLIGLTTIIFSVLIISYDVRSYRPISANIILSGMRASILFQIQFLLISILQPLPLLETNQSITFPRSCNPVMYNSSHCSGDPLTARGMLVPMSNYFEAVHLGCHFGDSEYSHADDVTYDEVTVSRMKKEFNVKTLLDDTECFLANSDDCSQVNPMRIYGVHGHLYGLTSLLARMRINVERISKMDVENITYLTPEARFILNGLRNDIVGGINKMTNMILTEGKEEVHKSVTILVIAFILFSILFIISMFGNSRTWAIEVTFVENVSWRLHHLLPIKEGEKEIEMISSMVTGHDSFDKGREAILDAAQQLVTSVNQYERQEVVMDAFYQLSSTVLAAFNEEEREMVARNYANIEKHKREHLLLRQRLTLIGDQLRSKNDAVKSIGKRKLISLFDMHFTDEDITFADTCFEMDDNNQNNNDNNENENEDIDDL